MFDCKNRCNQILANSVTSNGTQSSSTTPCIIAIGNISLHLFLFLSMTDLSVHAARTLPATPIRATMTAVMPMRPKSLTISLLEPREMPNTKISNHTVNVAVFPRWLTIRYFRNVMPIKILIRRVNRTINAVITI